MPAKQTILLLLLAAYIVGCDPRAGTNTPAPSTRTTAPGPAEEKGENADDTAELIKKSTSKPAIPAMIEIGGAEYDFPPVELRLKSREGRVIAQLVSDDPPAAAEEDYTGNSIYLEFPLDIPENRSLAGAHWEQTSATSDRDEELNGVYLRGQQIAIQPAQFRIDALDDVSPVKLRMSGTFLWFDEQNAGKPVELKAELMATVKLEPREK